jgi:D-3-phosphoglycerate dehydrogenase / 2-oxoglutarate reductase
LKDIWYVFDFDSTFTQVEAMEELAAISLENDPEKDVFIEKIKQLTDLAMEGKMPFGKSLKARIALLSAKKYHLSMLVNKLRKRVSPSFVRNKQFFKEHKGRVLIISGGFREFIEPVVKAYHIEPDCVFANTFVYDKKNNIIGADEHNLLAQEQGKVKLLKQLKLSGKVIMIGDGYTDYEVFAHGLANDFYAYTENISRPRVLEQAKKVAPSLDEILFSQRLPMSISYPKSRITAVLVGEATWLSASYFKREGYSVQTVKTIDALINKGLSGAVNCILFDPKLNEQTKLLSFIAEHPSKVLSVGVWGELVRPEAIKKIEHTGVAIFGSRYAHTRSVAELSLHYLLYFSRKKEEELFGKRLGIIGYGHSGSLLSVLAGYLGLEVYYYDIDQKPAIGAAKQVRNLGDLLKKSDFLVNVAGNRFGQGVFIGNKELNQLPKGAVLVHLGYDSSVDFMAVEKALSTGKLSGFYADILDESSVGKAKFKANGIITYGERLKTRQVQQNIALGLSEAILNYVNTGETKFCLNLPEVQLPLLHQSHRFIHIHKNKPGVLSQINRIIGKHSINILGQYLKTNEHLGYVITDVSKAYSAELIEELKQIPETVRFRVLY